MRISDLSAISGLQASERQKAGIYGAFIGRVEWLLRREALREGSTASVSRLDFDLRDLTIDQIAVLPGAARPATLWRIAFAPGQAEAYVKSSSGETDVNLVASGSIARRLAEVPFGPRDLSDAGLVLLRDQDFAFGNLIPEGTVIADGLVDSNALHLGTDVPFVEMAIVPLTAGELQGGSARHPSCGRLIAYNAADASGQVAMFRDSLAETQGLHTVFVRTFDGANQRIITARMPSVSGDEWYVMHKDGARDERTSERMAGAAMRDQVFAFLDQARGMIAQMPSSAAAMLEEQAAEATASMGH